MPVSRNRTPSNAGRKHIPEPRCNILTQRYTDRELRAITKHAGRKRGAVQDFIRGAVLAAVEPAGEVQP